jgi:hypothetical protein
LLGLWLDCAREEDEDGDEEEEFWEGASRGKRARCGQLGFHAEPHLDFPLCLDISKTE